MNKDQVIERFCILSTKVMSQQFKSQIPADCFCSLTPFHFQVFDERIIEFIESAVEEKLNKKN